MSYAVACQNGDTLFALECRRIQPQIVGQLRVNFHQSRLGHWHGILPNEESFGKPRIGVLKSKLDPLLVIGSRGSRRRNRCIV
jgi:hypothetical protein